MTRHLAALAALTLSACGSSYQDTENAQAAPPAHRPYRDLPELVTTTTVATTTTHVHRRAARSRSKARVESRESSPVTGDLSALLDALARCESGGNPQAVGGGGRYLGAFQMTRSTSRSLGLGDDPRVHSYEVQKAAAARIPLSAWPKQFPACSRRIL